MAKVIQSAIYLAGNKRALFKDIAPHLQDGNRKTFIDLFTGSGTMILNCKDQHMFEQYWGNDNQPQLIDMHEYLRDAKNFNALVALNDAFEGTEEGFERIKREYNKNPCPELLLLLQYRSNSNMMRWNKRGEFNVKYGKRERFNLERIRQHQMLMQDVLLTSLDYTLVIEDLLKAEELCDHTVYIDCPYLGTTAVYNENGKWTWMDDDLLKTYILELVNKGAKVVYSNTFHNRGVENTGLIKWVEQHNDLFDVYHLDKDYSNSSYFKSDKKTDEVLLVSK